MARKKSKRNARNGNILFAAEEQTNETPGNQTENQAVQSKPKSWWSDLGRGERVAAIAVCLLLVVGALGSGLGSRIVSTFSAGDANQKAGQTAQPAENSSMLAKLNPFAAAVTTTATPQLSKEYIYAGSRMLAVEDANASAASTPTVTPTPTLTLTPTPTPTTTPQSIYDAVADFSATSNLGTWSYGYKVNSSSPFTRYITKGQPWTGIDTWWQESISQYLMVAKNSTPATREYSGPVVHPADVLNLHPGPNGEQSVVRWTAPEARTYQIDATFKAIDTTGTSTTVSILHQGTKLWSCEIFGYNETSCRDGLPRRYTESIAVAAGETIDFVVDYGRNKTYNNDSTGLAAIITPPPPPRSTTPKPTPTPTPPPTKSVTYNAVTDFSATPNPTSPWRYGYKTTAASDFMEYVGYGLSAWSGINTWSPNDGGGGWLMLAYNSNSGQAEANYAGSINHPVDMLNLHPGASGEQSVLRWTVPEAGTYRIHGRFRGNDTYGTTTNVRILHQVPTQPATQIWSGNVNGYNTPDAVATYDFEKAVQAGETIHFAVGYGSGNNPTYNNDSTGLAAIITTTLLTGNTRDLFRIDTTIRRSWLDGIGENGIAMADEKPNLPDWAQISMSGE